VNPRRHYYLLLADVAGSTELRGKAGKAAWKRLEGVLEGASKSAGAPVLGLSLSYGDEVAGLYEEPAAIPEVVDAMREALHPATQLRYVVTRGRLGRMHEDIRQVGGRVFKRAAEEMEALKRRRGFARWATGKASLDSALSALAEAENALVERMSPYQREVWRLLQAGHRQHEIVKELGKLQQSVSQAVEAGAAREALACGAAMGKLLETT